MHNIVSLVQLADPSPTHHHPHPPTRCPPPVPRSSLNHSPHLILVAPLSSFSLPSPHSPASFPSKTMSKRADSRTPRGSSKKRRKTAASPAASDGPLTADDIELGMSVLIERKGQAELAEVVKPSKKEGMWAVRCGDGKLVPKTPDKMRRPPQDNSDDDADDAAETKADSDSDDNADDAEEDSAAVEAAAAAEEADEAQIEEDGNTLMSFEKGTKVMAERDGGFEAGVVSGPSKKEGQWKIKFDADGKVRRGKRWRRRGGEEEGKRGRRQRLAPYNALYGVRSMVVYGVWCVAAFEPSNHVY